MLDSHWSFDKFFMSFPVPGPGIHCRANGHHPPPCGAYSPYGALVMGCESHLPSPESLGDTHHIWPLWQAQTPGRSSCSELVPSENLLNEWMNEPNKHLWIDQSYKYILWNLSLEVSSPGSVCSRSCLQTQHGSLKFLLLRGSCYSINLELPNVNCHWTSRTMTWAFFLSRA